MTRLGSLFTGLVFGALWIGVCYGFAVTTFGGRTMQGFLTNEQILFYSRWATLAFGTLGYLFALIRRGRDTTEGMGSPHSWDGFLLGLPIMSLACLAAAFDPRPMELQEL